MTYGFIFVATGQFEFPCNRLQMSMKDDSFADLVTKQETKHILSVSFTRDIQTIFMTVDVPSFVSTLVIACAIVSQIYAETLYSTEYFINIVYYKFALVEILIYRWCESRHIVECDGIRNVAYNCKGAVLQRQSKKCLIFKVQLGQRDTGISLNSHQCELYINTFLWIIKTSYGVFNLIKSAYGA